MACKEEGASLVRLLDPFEAVQLGQYSQTMEQSKSQYAHYLPELPNTDCGHTVTDDHRRDTR